MSMRARTFRHLWIALCLGLAACGRSPKQWIADGKAQAGRGELLGALADFDRALAKPGPWRAQALVLKAEALFGLQRYEEAARCADDSTAGEDPVAARAARVLALNALAQAGDVAKADREYSLLGRETALGDTVVAAAAVKLGLAAAAPTYVMAQLDAIAVQIARVGRVPALDATAFPWRVEFQDPREDIKVASPDGKSLVWRGQDDTGYWLFLGDSEGKNAQKLKACKNGFQPVWSPDSKAILFCAMDWRNEARSLFIYDIASGKSRRAFNAKHKVGSLAAWSPDGSKIVFSYYGDLWLMNSNGIGRSLLNLAGRIGKPVEEPAEIAWSGDSRRLAYRMTGDPTVYILDLAPRL